MTMSDFRWVVKAGEEVYKFQSLEKALEAIKELLMYGEKEVCISPGKSSTNP